MPVVYSGSGATLICAEDSCLPLVEKGRNVVRIGDCLRFVALFLGWKRFGVRALQVLRTIRTGERDSALAALLGSIVAMMELSRKKENKVTRCDMYTLAFAGRVLRYSKDTFARGYH